MCGRVSVGAGTMGVVMIEPATPLFATPETPSDPPEKPPERAPRRAIKLGLEGLNPAQQEAVTLPVGPGYPA